MVFFISGISGKAVQPDTGIGNRLESSFPIDKETPDDNFLEENPPFFESGEDQR
ncbi:hypothetical protein OAF41_01350 [bacterium]|jgi:hypothetical protein|nr:hypothetical protein [bacterium]